MRTSDVEILDKIIRTRGGFGIGSTSSSRGPTCEPNPDLLDGKLDEHFYSRELNFGEPAPTV